jgi:hypothetical protein
LGYLSFHHHLLLDLSPSGYLQLTAEVIPSDSVRATLLL